MSNLVYPTLPGLAFPVGRIPTWKTNTMETASGREFRAASMTYPSWTYRLKYDFLRDTAAAQEARTLAGFFNRVRGNFDSFLFSDPDDSSVTAQAFGIGDGATKTFQLIRALGGFNEPVCDLNGVPLICKNVGDWRGNERQYTTPRINLSTESEFRNGVSDATPRSGLVSASAISSYAGAIAFGRDGVTDSYAYKSNFTAVIGQTYTFSLTVAMDDGLAPAFGSGTAANVANDFVIVMAGFAISPLTYIVASMGGGLYRVSATYTAATATPNFGVVKYSVNSSRTFKVTAYQLETGAAATSYIPTTTAPVTVTDCAVANGVVTFAIAPQLGASLTWSGSYYWRCRFTSNQMELSKFMQSFWELGKVEFKTVKP